MNETFKLWREKASNFLTEKNRLTHRSLNRCFRLRERGNCFHENVSRPCMTLTLAGGAVFQMMTCGGCISLSERAVGRKKSDDNVAYFALYLIREGNL